MADIPSQGIVQFDVFDPGSVNIEQQAYPRPLDPNQNLPRQLVDLLNISLVALAPPQNAPQGGPIPSFAQVESQPFRQPSFSLGTALPATPTFDAGAFQAATPAAEFIITPVGNFQTNITAGDKAAFTIQSVQVLNGTTTPNRIFQLTFNPAVVNFFNGGIDLSFRNLFLPSQAPAKNPQNVPTRFILFWSRNILIVAESETEADGTVDTFPLNAASVGNSDGPVAGQSVNFDNIRDGFEVNFQIFAAATKTVVIDGTPQAPVTTVAPSLPAISSQANDGVVKPFIGSGTQIPLLAFQNLPLPGAFAPAFQSLKGQGLPVDVFA